MTQEQFNQRYKEVIYEPYTEAWAIMKTLKEADLTKDSVWKDYFDKCNEFEKKYPNEIGGSIYRVMLDCGSECKRILDEQV